MTDDEFQEFLTDISDAFSKRNYALWRNRMRLPFSMVTGTGPVTLNSDAQVRDNYDGYLQAMNILRVSEVLRAPVKLEHCPDGTVLATYRTYLRSGGSNAREPYVSTALMHPDPGMWRMSAILNALGHHHWTGRNPPHTGESDD